MSIKRPTIAIAAAALFAAVGSTSVSAQENCGFMYQRVMEAERTAGKIQNAVGGMKDTVREIVKE